MRARASSSLRTSALMNSASEPKERSSLTRSLPASSRRPATTTLAPFLAKATAAARPIPVKAPVIKTTWLSIVILAVALPYRQSMDRGGGEPQRLRPVAGALVERHVVSTGVREKDFVSWGACLGDMDRHYGAAAPSLFHRRRRGGQPDGRGREAAAHRATFAQPPNPGSRIRGWRATDEPEHARHRTDRRRPRFSRPCAARAHPSRSGGRSGEAGRRTAQAGLRAWIHDWNGDRLVAESDAHSSRPTAQHEAHHRQPVLARPGGGADAGQARRRIHARGAARRKPGLSARADGCAPPRGPERCPPVR